MSRHCHQNKGIIFFAAMTLLLSLNGCDDSHGNSSQEPAGKKCAASSECSSNQICHQEVCTSCKDVNTASLTGDNFCICSGETSAKCTNGEKTGYCCEHQCMTDEDAWNNTSACGCNNEDKTCTQPKQCTPMELDGFNTCLIDGKECTEDPHCSDKGNYKHCDMGSNKCVECTQKEHCAGTDVTCNQQTHKCEAETHHENECNDDSQCSDKGNNSHCDTASHQCVECTSNEHCTGTDQACNPQNHKCEVIPPCDKDIIVASLRGNTDNAACNDKTKEKINWLTDKGDGTFEFTSASETSEDTCLIICGDIDLSDAQNEQVGLFKAFTKTIESDATILGINKPTLTVNKSTGALLPSKKDKSSSEYVNLTNIVIKNLKINANDIEYGAKTMNGLITSGLENSILENIEVTLKNPTVNYKQNHAKWVGLLVGKMINGGKLSGCSISVQNNEPESAQTDNKINVLSNVDSLGGFVGYTNGVDILNNSLDATISSCAEGNEPQGSFITFGGLIGEMTNCHFEGNSFTGAIRICGSHNPIVLNVGGLVGVLSLKQGKGSFKNNYLALSDFYIRGKHQQGFGNVSGVGGIIGYYNVPEIIIEDTSSFIKELTLSTWSGLNTENNGGVIGHSKTGIAALKNVQSIVLSFNSHESFHFADLIGNADTTAGNLTENSENVFSVLLGITGLLKSSGCDDGLMAQISNASENTMMKMRISYSYNNIEQPFCSICGSGCTNKLDATELVEMDNYKEWKKYCFTKGDVQLSIPLPIEPPKGWGFAEGFCTVSGE